MEEQWKRITGYDNYEVSSHGRVRSLNYKKTGEIRLLKQNTDGDGYFQVGLCKNGKRKQKKIHRLVAKEFIPNPNNYSEVNHINENKHDNRVENLEWCDRKQNINHGTRTERSAKAQEKRVKCIETGEIFDSAYDVKRKTGLSQSHINECCNGKRKTCGKLHWQYVDD